PPSATSARSWTTRWIRSCSTTSSCRLRVRTSTWRASSTCSGACSRTSPRRSATKAGRPAARGSGLAQGGELRGHPRALGQAPADRDPAQPRLGLRVQLRRRQAHDRVVALGPGVRIGEQVAVPELEVPHLGLEFGDRLLEVGRTAGAGGCGHRLLLAAWDPYYGRYACRSNEHDRPVPRAARM